MILRSLNITRTAQSREALQFTATFQEIIVVTSESVKIPFKAKSSEVAKSATKKSNIGKQTTAATTTQQQSKSSSILAKFGSIF